MHEIETMIAPYHNYHFGFQHRPYKHIQRGIIYHGARLPQGIALLKSADLLSYYHPSNKTYKPWHCNYVLPVHAANKPGIFPPSIHGASRSHLHIFTHLVQNGGGGGGNSAGSMGISNR